MKRNFEVSQQLGERLISSLLLVLCVFVFIEIRDFSEFGAIYPFMVNLFLAFFSITFFIKSWVPFLREKFKKTENKETTELVFDIPSFVIAFSLLIFYVYFLITFIGYLVGSIIFAGSIVILIRLRRKELNYKSLVTSILFAIILSTSIYYVFRYFLNIRLPTGIFI